MLLAFWFLPACVPDPPAALADPPGVQLHLHGPASEGDTTHKFQADQARNAGVDALWWTDHDYRYTQAPVRAPGWAPGDALKTAPLDPGGVEDWWAPSADDGTALDARLDDALSRGDSPGLRLASTGPGAASISWEATQRRLYRPLFAGVTVRFSLWTPPDHDPARRPVRVELPLSRISPAVVRTIWFVDPADPFVPDEGGVVVPLAAVPGGWADVSLDLSAFADSDLPEGRDLTLRGFVAHLGPSPDGRVEAAIGDVAITESVWGADLLAAQADLLAGAGDVPRQRIGSEISYETNDRVHLVAWCPDAPPPFVDYASRDLLERPAEIADDMRGAGCTVGLAHPFGVTLGLDDVQDPGGMIARTAEELRDLRGADVVEIGYNARVLDLDSHLALWDALLAEGGPVPAIGASDQHVSQGWGQYRNPMVTWPLVDQGASDAEILDAIREGRAWFGDPNRVVDPAFGLWIDGEPAEGRVIDAGGKARVDVHVAGLREAGEVRLVLDGGIAGIAEVGTSPQDLRFEVSGPGAVRVEVRTLAGEGVLFSNAAILE